jgi:hypothetical protein
VPGWAKAAVDEWLAVAQVEDGVIFRCVSHSGTVWGSGISEKVVRWSCVSLPKKLRSRRWLPMTFVAPLHGSVIQPVESLSKSSPAWTSLGGDHGAVSWLPAAESCARCQ